MKPLGITVHFNLFDDDEISRNNCDFIGITNSLHVYIVMTLPEILTHECFSKLRYQHYCIPHMSRIHDVELFSEIHII